MTMLKFIWSDYPKCKCLPYMAPTTLETHLTVKSCVTSRTFVPSVNKTLACNKLYYLLGLTYDFSSCLDDEVCSTLTYESEVLRSDWSTDIFSLGLIQNALNSNEFPNLQNIDNFTCLCSQLIFLENNQTHCLCVCVCPNTKNLVNFTMSMNDFCRLRDIIDFCISSCLKQSF
jgi:hypothetical protein